MNDFYDVGAFEGSTNELLQLNLGGEHAIFIFIDLKYEKLQIYQYHCIVFCVQSANAHEVFRSPMLLIK